jgi:hypothetical protein
MQTILLLIISALNLGVPVAWAQQSSRPTWEFPHDCVFYRELSGMVRDRFGNLVKNEGQDYRCHISKRDWSSHTNVRASIIDIAWEDGEKSAYILWPDGTAEILSRGKRYRGSWSYTHRQGWGANQGLEGLTSISNTNSGTQVNIPGRWALID